MSTRERTYRATRKARRVLVNGRLVAPVPERMHGKPSTYTNWSCRCLRCSVAWSEYRGHAAAVTT
jgi:hypothetical protein